MTTFFCGFFQEIQVFKKVFLMKVSKWCVIMFSYIFYYCESSGKLQCVAYTEQSFLLPVHKVVQLSVFSLQLPFSRWLLPGCYGCRVNPITTPPATAAGYHGATSLSPVLYSCWLLLALSCVLPRGYSLHLSPSISQLAAGSLLSLSRGPGLPATIR